MNTGKKTAYEKTGEIPTVAGAVPAHFGQRVEMATAGNLAAFSRLPKAGERCAVSGASRSWLIETDAKLGPDDRFLVRVRRRGCLRGTVFVSVPRLCKFLHSAAAGDVEGYASAGEATK